MKVFFLILGIILLVILLGYIFYRVTRKGTDIGFQDFLIDSVFHSKRPDKEPSTSIKTSDSGNIIVNEGIKEVPSPVVAAQIADPLTSYVPPPTDPLSV